MRGGAARWGGRRRKQKQKRKKKESRPRPAAAAAIARGALMPTAAGARDLSKVEMFRICSFVLKMSAMFS